LQQHSRLHPQPRGDFSSAWRRNRMSQRALSMGKIKEVLRLRYDLGLLQNEIARSCSISQSSVNRYLERASAAGLSWPLPQDCDDRRLNELLFPAAPAGGGLVARAAGLCGHPSAAAKPQVCDLTTALGRVSPEPARGISLQSLLRVVPALAAQARPGAASAASCGRQNLR